MSDKSQALNAIPDRTVFMVRGKLTYSRLTRKIDGEELKESIRREQQMGTKFPTTVPHTIAQICDAQIVPNNSLDPDTTAKVNTYLNYALYQSRSAGSTGYTLRVVNTGNIPWVCARQPDGTLKQVALEQELANGQIVTLVLNVYASKTYTNKGLGITGIIVESPTVAYYAGGLDAQLRAAGIIFSSPLVPQEQINNPTAATPQETAMTTQTVAPMAPPVTPPSAGVDAFTNMPQNTPQTQQYSYQTPPIGAPNGLDNQAQQANNPFPMPTPVNASPQTPIYPQGNGSEDRVGISYDASDRQYH